MKIPPPNTNPFLAWFHKDQARDLKSLTVENIQTLSLNALGSSGLELNRINHVKPLSLNLDTLRFIPSNTYLPQCATNFVYRENVDSNPAYINDFFEFIGSSLVNFANLQIDKEGFPAYFEKKFPQLSESLSNLNTFYKFYKNIEHQELIAKAWETADAIKHCLMLLNGGPSNHKVALKILNLQKFDKLKKVIDISLHYDTHAIPILEEELGTDLFPDFFRECLKMSHEKLNNFCKELKTILYGNENVRDDLCVFLLKNPHFAPLYPQLISKILQKKNPQSEPVKFALEFVYEIMSSFKINPKAGIDFFHKINYEPLNIALNFVQFIFISKDMYIEDYYRYLINLIESVDLENITITTPGGRRLLLKSCEFMFASNPSINQANLKDWVHSYPETANFPTIQKALQINCLTAPALSKNIIA